MNPRVVRLGGCRFCENGARGRVVQSRRLAVPTS